MFLFIPVIVMLNRTSQIQITISKNLHMVKALEEVAGNTRKSLEIEKFCRKRNSIPKKEKDAIGIV